MRHLPIILLFQILCVPSVFGQVDTIHIDEVVSLASRGRLMSMSDTLLRAIGAHRISDAVQLLPGVSVRDYGGLGGLKTVSVRSMGAQHTVVAVDGVPVGNMQTGAVDIGMFQMQSVGELRFYNAQSNNALESARMLASGSVLDIRSDAVLSQHNQHSASIRGGSFGTFSPSISSIFRLNNSTATTVAASFDRCNGDYPFVLHYGAQSDSSSTERRQNGDLTQLRIDANLHHDGEMRVRTKLFFFASERGLPKATTFYNLSSHERLTDYQAFAQAQADKTLGALTLRITARHSFAYQRYANPEGLASTPDEVRYRQQESYLALTAAANPLRSLTLSASVDATVGTLRSASVDGEPTRVSLLSSVAARYSQRWFSLNGSLVAAWHSDMPSSVDYRRLTPMVSLNVSPAEWLALRAFYKDVFRMPSFNDLYYNGIGSRNLVPERARQLSAGVEMRWAMLGATVKAAADAYRNIVDDKIVAMPTKNIYVWTMLNVGMVDIRGADISGEVRRDFTDEFKLYLWGGFTYQRVLDMTDSESSTYRQQIAYVPRVAASATARIDTRWVWLGYALAMQGRRYVLGQNIEANSLAKYSDHTLTIGREVVASKVKMNFSVEIHNLLNENYEVVRNFPMPGRAVYFKFGVDL